MLRSLYRSVVRLHPSAFRRRFGDEMLSIFDSAKSNHSELALLMDGMLSLRRQWLSRPRFSKESASMTSVPSGMAAVPSFATFDSFRPQTSAIFDGLVLSIALFCLTCFSIRYSWIRVLHIHIPEFQASGYPSMPTAAGHTDARSSEHAKNKKTNARFKLEDEDRQYLSVEPVPVEAHSIASAFETTSASPVVSSNPQIQIYKPARTAPLDLRSYVGRYVCSSPHFTILIADGDGNLAIKIDDQPRRTISPLSPTTFVIDGTQDQIEFDRNGDGVIRQLRLVQENRQYTAERQ